jgi:hypothetical protein
MTLNARDNAQQAPAAATQAGNHANRTLGRRSFLRKGTAVAGTVTAGAVMLGGERSALARGPLGGLTRGDAAILRFLAAAEIIEADLWQQYNELGGI